MLVAEDGLVLDFSAMLERVGLAPSEVLMIRHQPREADLKPVLPWLVVERPDLFLAWQQIQWPAAERSMVKAKVVAVFIGQEAGKATFAGLSRVGAWRSLSPRDYPSFPGNAELMAFGMTPPELDAPDQKAFDLEPLAALHGYVGRLVVGWPKPERTWCRWAANGRFPVFAITEENRFLRGMPDWRDLVLSWISLQALPASWRAVLAQWRGVYYIYDTVRRLGYVGSACGEENIYGRWQSYAHSGHGGNINLRQSRPESLRFSILQRTSPDLDTAELVAIENAWKMRLHTREFGLNAN